jgi:2,4-dienoyl-CoA reductase-like NADH-dependent reductase (Old Yellow Enzyme family)
MIHLGNLSLSGSGLLIIEATSVVPEGRISPADLGLWSDENEAALARVLKAIRTYSEIPVAIQLAHAGRKASCEIPWKGHGMVPASEGGWSVLAPSPIPFNPDDPEPIALDETGLTHIKDAFVAAGRRADRLGIDAIELHAAHGYLLHQFLSPISNQRTDNYGGSLENRMRFPLEVFDAIRATFSSHKPIGVRISGTDWVPGGWDVDQSIILTKELERRGCAYLHVSSGGLSPLQEIPIGPNYQVPLAEHIKRETVLPIIAVGLITEPEQAEEIIASGKADMAALARGMLFDPRWPWHAAAKLAAQVEAPPQYWRAQPHGHKDLFKTS